MIKFFFDFFNKLIVSFTVLLTILIIIVVLLFYHYSKDLPDYHQLAAYEPPVVTRLYANDGRLLEEYATEHRIFIPIANISKQIINAFIAAEDKNFYEHPGVDLSSIARALFQNASNLVNNNKSLVGGSTITQQVVKNFLLTSQKSLDRKIKEAILSFRISQIYSKDRILELYLNQIYLGYGSYGVASAALNYFNKSIDELTTEEIAFIAALPKAPSNYDPRRNYQRAKNRRDWVINRMLEEKAIGEQEAVIAINQPIKLVVPEVSEIVQADSFTETVRREIITKFGSQALYQEGLTVKTTLEPKLQSIAQESFRQGLFDYDQRLGYRGAFTKLNDLTDWSLQLTALSKNHNLLPLKLAVILEVEANRIKIGIESTKYYYIPINELKWTKKNLKSLKELFQVGEVIIIQENKNNNIISYQLRQIPKVNGGLIALEPNTGRVLAMVGGFDSKSSEFNRSTQAKRQPGSAFKPFIYLAALENGFTPSSIIIDEAIELDQGPNLPLWRPKNYSNDFLGPITLRQGLEKSRNTMTIKLAQSLGINKLVEITKRFRINNSPIKNFSLALGSCETDLLSITNAYAMIVNGGKNIEPHLIEKIQDRKGKTLFKEDKRECPNCLITSNIDTFATIVPMLSDDRATITDPRTAYQIVSMLEGATQRGTAKRVKQIGRVAIGGKTGTTNDSLDAWFIGFTQNIVLGVYVGYDKPQSLGKKETGTSVALPIFNLFMSSYLKNRPDIPFKIPEGIKLVKVNLNSGLPTSSALSEEVIYENFKVGTEPQLTDDKIYKNNNSVFDLLDVEEIY